MSNKITVNILKVFVDKDGKFGNPVGVVINDNDKLNDEQKQKIAHDLNFSETVFIDKFGKIPEVSVFNPIKKVRFAGHAVLGTAYFIKNVLNKNIDSIKCGEKMVKIKEEDKINYITAPLSIMPNWNYEELSSANEVENISKDEMLNKLHTVVWAYIDKVRGLIRARTFAPDWGILEDQANGSGSMLLASKLNKNLEIHHGEGSIIFAKSVDDKFAEVGGLVSLSEGKFIDIN